MTMSRPRHPLAAGLGLAGAAGLLLLAACEMPRPTEVTPAGEMPLASIRSGGAYTMSGRVTPAAVREAVAAVLVDSDATAALGTPVDLYFVADASGRVVHAEYQRRRSTMLLAPTRRDGATAERTRVDSVRVRMRTGAPDAGAVASVRATPLPGAVASLNPAAIGSIDVLKAKPGDVVADGANVIWVTLKEGATLESARLAGEALREANARRDRTITAMEARRRPGSMPGSAAGDARGDTAGVTSFTAPRVRVDARGGESFGGENVRVEGPRLSAPDSPMLVVDGVLIARDRADAFMRDLQPDRIESVEVVKGAAARKLWGDDGANGVIQVTLKKPAPR